ncbi:hypothetical protein Clacol_007835 [Clathrus columnatus]|uniref:General substrate transporter n=1 Tax=Clathrus columnatus TaxID=1419009 RepID=A0AAV5AKC3_9AGAM|nr:hypothetical protein Clacol_007835 [Clathrus columnatus]
MCGASSSTKEKRESLPMAIGALLEAFFSELIMTQYDIGVISGCLIMEDFNNRFGDILNSDGTRTLSASRQSVITSLLSAGQAGYITCPSGALAQAFTSDRFGRRGSVLIWSIIFTIGVAVQTGTINSVVQITIGFPSGIVPLYNGETAPKKIRGALLVLYQLQIIIGYGSPARINIFLSYVLDLATHNIKSTASWKIPREDEARAALAEINGVPPNDPLVTEIIEELELGIREENEGGKATWLECFSTRNLLWKRTGNGMIAGTTLSPYVIQTILGGVSVAGTIPALYLIDTLGRRKSLLIGSAAEAAGLVGHFTLAPTGTPLNQLTSRNKAGGDTLIAFAVLHLFSYSMFWGPTPWVYLGESYPLRVRAKAIALGSATNWIWNFLLSFFAPRIANDIGPLILLIFFGMLIFGFVYVWLFVPETKGLTLEEVDEMYRSGVAPWHSASWKPSGRLQVHHHEKERDDKESQEFAEQT